MQKRKVLVVGLGISGIAICEALLKEPQTEVTATDSKPLQHLELSDKAFKRLSEAGCRFVLGSNDVGNVDEFDEIIVSPGVPLDIPLLNEARKRGYQPFHNLFHSHRTRSLYK